ncbi:hypothetical protein F0Q45_12780 [Mycobacterium simiae]|uniref:Uncharacterized protein n=1 Tax=Mycobacterium simiae TaxID=1784 RepID=A0A5B1BRL4_MYCSI|nr:WXG100 family type VII secretion target [Mycobacterium simiae]KAA1249874.1 hypothetical protein F0Q45_12780 [Mycobacterium simiae]
MAADEVHYNYPLMESIAAQLQQCGTTAQGLLDAGRANKQTLLGSFHGDTANTFLDSFTKFEHVCQDTIEVTQRGVNAYHNGTAGMQTNEKQMMGFFPG